ncbi:hypothetical protein [Persicirhabdus sediminis]|uniref:Cytochrome c domain-containing protein n=1 Tax=Persicirhabdus sediminis TaxID=454144 RepID=A0A8J7MBI5_9BACT|nr:hypothetical protein [Persicirhabdus sediminis]MBK1790397.1 hypothetical protein [Persicirhabdus sediminis]
MKLKYFIILMLTSFGLPFIFMLLVPAIKMTDAAPLPMGDKDSGKSEVYFNPVNAGLISQGAEVYASNGCYNCHTQLIRPTSLSASSSVVVTDLWRPDFAGVMDDEKRGDTRRETTAWDYQGEKFAQIGTNRIGQDLSNVGHRINAKAKALGISPEMYLYLHFYNPRNTVTKTHEKWSNCPSQLGFFEQVKNSGQGTDIALPLENKPGYMVIPNDQAVALTSYLLSLKRDQPVPDSINYNPNKDEEE